MDDSQEVTQHGHPVVVLIEPLQRSVRDRLSLAAVRRPPGAPGDRGV
ncbi:hypothetical protein AB0K93_25705 [Streptomyces sp. NPDC052676]